MAYLQRRGFKKYNDGTYEEFCEKIDTIDELMEDAIIDVKRAKGQGHLDIIINEVKKSLDVILTHDEISKDYCIRFLLDYDDILLINEIQLHAPNQLLKRFVNNYGRQRGRG